MFVIDYDTDYDDTGHDTLYHRVMLFNPFRIDAIERLGFIVQTGCNIRHFVAEEIYVEKPTAPPWDDAVPCSKCFPTPA